MKGVRALQHMNLPCLVKYKMYLATGVPKNIKIIDQALSGSATAQLFASVRPQLCKETLEILSTLGFESMTPVQSAAIPLFLSHKDVAAEVSIIVTQYAF